MLPHVRVPRTGAAAGPVNRGRFGLDWDASRNPPESAARPRCANRAPGMTPLWPRQGREQAQPNRVSHVTLGRAMLQVGGGKKDAHLAPEDERWRLCVRGRAPESIGMSSSSSSTSFWNMACVAVNVSKAARRTRV